MYTFTIRLGFQNFYFTNLCGKGWQTVPVKERERKETHHPPSENFLELYSNTETYKSFFDSSVSFRYWGVT